MAEKPLPVLLLAVDFDDGSAWLNTQPAPPTAVVFITVRSPARARGLMAGAVLATPAAQQHAKYQRLLEEAMVCVAWQRRGRPDAGGPR